MKFITITLGDNKIELHNSSFGKETVKVNGEEVSSKHSILGTSHNFTISENGKSVDCKLVTGYNGSGIYIDLFKDGKPIIETRKGGCWTYILLIIVAIVVFLLMSDGILKFLNS